jgi:hypothetical protein
MSVNIKEYMVLHNVALLRLWLLFLMLVQLVCRVLLLIRLIYLNTLQN